MNDYQHYLGQVIGSNVLALALIALALTRPRIARWIAGCGLIAASIANTLVIVANPQGYITGYGALVWPIYRGIIYGPFAAHPLLYVRLIAAGQFISGFLTLFGRRYRRLGLLGELIFLLAIVPLGVGSAFPSTLLMAIAIAILIRQASGKKRRRGAAMLTRQEIQHAPVSPHHDCAA